MILIHGTGASKNWWDPIAPLLLDKFNVIALDLPGMGDSDHCDVYSFENFGNSVLSIIKNEKLTENIVLVGHSLGGHVARLCSNQTTRTNCWISYDRYSSSTTKF